MADLAQLQQVLELRERTEQQAAAAMAEARQQLDIQEQRLQLSQDYRNQYLSDLQQRGSGGVEVNVYSQNVAFIGRLDVAIAQQHQAIAQANRVLQEKRHRWQRCHADTRAIEHLIEREQKRLALQRTRREQRTMDEYALRTWWYQKDGMRLE